MFENKLLMLATLLVSTCLSGCGAGNGEGLGEDKASETQANLASIQSTVFSRICTECHIGAAAPEGLQLDSEDNSFALLVNVSSNQNPALLRVNPGDADNSYLIRKLEGIGTSRMPLGQPPLPPETIEKIRQWINDGALPSSF